MLVLAKQSHLTLMERLVPWARFFSGVFFVRGLIVLVRNLIARLREAVRELVREAVLELVREAMREFVREAASILVLQCGQARMRCTKCI